VFSSLSGSRRPSPRYPSLTSIVVILPMTRSKMKGHGIVAPEVRAEEWSVARKHLRAMATERRLEAA
jgi:hypothetical protein